MKLAGLNQLGSKLSVRHQGYKSTEVYFFFLEVAAGGPKSQRSWLEHQVSSESRDTAGMAGRLTSRAAQQ